MRRRSRSAAGSLDSLLDTMTNVVGILVIVLAVTQLGVRDAVQRISAQVGVDPQKLAEAERKLAEAEDLRKQLHLKLSVFRLGSGEDPALVKERIESRISVVEAEIADLQLARQKAVAQEEKKRQEKLDELKRQREEVEKLNEQLAAADEQLAALRALLAETPDREVLPAKVVHLPDPRPAPEGMEPLTFFCRNGRVLFVDVKGLRDRAQRRAKGLIRLRSLDHDPAAGIDGKLLAELFNERGLPGTPGIDVTLEVPGAWPRLRFEPEKTAGDTVEQLERSTSSYRTVIRRIDPSRYYAQFLVWPDGFEVYLAARRIATEAGILAGWQPMTEDQQHAVALEGGIRCGPPPKPKPKPPPGEQPPKPPPPPKPKPVDTID